ncbi:cytochrome c [Variovorax sp. dw_954]|uniref:SorU family sulfite dehydrogenase c-type cytochrome subunit n=1 Tax=Variovorax sp. dw_954 TaxID=2720078 RepID=UPI001BD59A64|nr:cytochrome c [Variovorax sp. dw_954]
MREVPATGRWPVLAAAAVWLYVGFAGPSFAADPALAEGRQLFVNGVAPAPTCALCHTLKDAGATGQIGPNLDDLKPDLARVAAVIRSGMGPMPAFTALTDAQVTALARYVSTVVKP